jgi:hypothetical protein
MNVMLPSSNRTGTRFEWAFCLLLALVLVLGGEPYRGVRHDSILYTGQALAHLNPGWAASDLYFAHGSQDRFSIFSSCVAWLLGHHVNLAVADMALLFAAWAVWVVALLALTRTLAPRERWFAVLVVMASSHFFGTARILGFMEPFVTARTWAEPVVLLALAALLDERWVLAVLGFVLAMLLHPLVALPVGAVALAYLISRDRRWTALLLLALPAIGLAFAGVAPFDGLLKTYDPQWFQATLLSNDIVYVSNWSRTDATITIALMVTLWLACRGSSTPFARLGRAATAATPVLFLASFIGADLFHNVLITQLQLWRVTWILDVLALASLPLLLEREWRKGAKGRCAAIAVFVCACAMDAWVPTGWMLGCWALFALLLSASRTEVKSSIIGLAILATVVAALGLVALQVVNAVQQLGVDWQGMKIAQPFSIPFTLPLVALPVALVLLLGWRRAGAARAASVAVAATLLVMVATHWDQRSPWARYVESAQPGAHPFDALVPPGAQVYWNSDTAAAWILLQRANFISSSQTSGLLFNRETALAALQRVPALLAVMGNQGRCASLQMVGATALDRGVCDLPRDKFLGLCTVRPSHPDFLVAPVDFGTGVVSRWTFAPDDGSAPTTYALYDCSKLQ